MSCYLRHMKSILDEAGINAADTASRRKVDRELHNAVGVEYKDCPAAWRKLKQDFLADEAKRRALVERLRKAVL